MIRPDPLIRPCAASSLLECGNRGEEAAPRAIGPLATPVLPVDTWQRFRIGDDFLDLRQFETNAVHRYRGGWHDEAVIGAAAPFAVLRTTKSAFGDPAVMGKSGRRDGKGRHGGEEGSTSSSDHVLYHDEVSPSAASA